MILAGCGVFLLRDARKTVLKTIIFIKIERKSFESYKTIFYISSLRTVGTLQSLSVNTETPHLWPITNFKMHGSCENGQNFRLYIYT